MDMQHPGGWGYNISELRQSIGRKADSHEVSTLRSDVSRLENTVRELRAEADGLRARLQEVDAWIVGQQ